jgi:hypothetical protein
MISRKLPPAKNNQVTKNLIPYILNLSKNKKRKKIKNLEKNFKNFKKMKKTKFKDIKVMIVKKWLMITKNNNDPIYLFFCK